MASSTLDKVSNGSRIFIDSTIFVYHFTGSSAQCRNLLERCERGDIKGISSVVVLAEVAHRLMMIEALSQGFISGKNLVQKLRARPDIVQKLHLYQEQVERIPIMGIEIISLELKTFLRSDDLRTQYGLLINDSLVAASAIEEEANGIASADPDFARLDALAHFKPNDLTL
jgi:predicted nucleic acid-binding protein